MLCPNDNADMHQVKILSHYGQPLFLDQCEKCGGIWFDKSELYRAKQGEAEKTDLLDVDSLRSPAFLENKVHLCPKDRAKLFRFDDKYFPRGIIVERCPVCSGFWLNRGEFTKFQKARQELLQKQPAPEDKILQREIEIILSDHAGSNDVLKRLGNFLSTPVDGNIADIAETSPKAVNTINTVLNVLGIILRLFLFR